MSAYLADSMLHYYDLEPDCTIVAEENHKVVGALLGAVDTRFIERNRRQYIQPLLRRQIMRGAYGFPAWLWADLLTHFAGFKIDRPVVDLEQYPAHLHIGVLPAWRRKGIGTALMEGYECYLRSRDVQVYHLYASSFHPFGFAFYGKIDLEVIGEFHWQFHDGFRSVDAVETIFARRLD
jgi:GNAT superfamily N-acetyltransferase